MSEAIALAFINNLPMILAGLAALISALAAAWRTGSAVKASLSAQQASEAVRHEVGVLKVTVNGTLQKMIEAITASSRAETTAARAEGLGEAALQTALAATGPAVASPPPPPPPRDTGGRRTIDKSIP